jgi:hypothetical protein
MNVRRKKENEERIACAMRRRRSSANVLAMFSIMKNLQTSQK